LTSGDSAPPPDPAPDPAPAGPLAGLRVIDASLVLAAPYLAMLLGDLGADVIKVERPGEGDPTRGWGPPFVGSPEGPPGYPAGRRVSAYFLSANRNKRSIALDLARPAGRDVFERLLAGADVLVENLLPAQWRRLGFPGDLFTAGRPRLIQVKVTGYGSGPGADRPAYDVVLQAESGLMAVTGFPEGEPVRVGVAVLDLMTALYALSGVLAALHARDAGAGTAGTDGRRVEVSLADAGASCLSYAAQSWLADGREPPRLGSRHPNLVPYGAFPTADGWIVVGVGSEALWRRFCEALDRPDLAGDPRFATNRARVENRGALESLLAEIFARDGTAHWQRRMAEHRVPAGPPFTVGEVVEAARERGQVAPLPAGAYGDLETIAAPLLLDGRRPLARRAPPALGEHTIEVLTEAGFDRDETERLIEEGVAEQA
jgi:formyl-CoA transferase/CoA:oxalate CoA-transferase